jgi:cyclic pyranopterin phosphate synthase
MPAKRARRTRPPRHRLTHLDASGRPRMVDVSAKPATLRRAVARGRLQLSPAGWRALHAARGAGKGDPLTVAHVAAVTAAKRTGEWIPLAHPLPIEAVDLAWTKLPRARVLQVEVAVGLRGSTGVEMEALTACAAALLCVYDMLKAVDRGMVLGPLWLVEKSGGRSGRLRFGDPPVGTARRRGRAGRSTA